MLSDLQGAPSALCFKINLRQLGLQCKTGSRVTDGVAEGSMACVCVWTTLQPGT